MRILAEGYGVRWGPVLLDNLLACEAAILEIERALPKKEPSPPPGARGRGRTR